MTRKIPLNAGLYAIVDDQDYLRAMQLHWYVQQIGTVTYAAHNGSDGFVYLHRFILNAAKGTIVDHQDGNGLNCTRSNLRFATQAENGRNRGKQRNNTSGFKGVYWHKKNRKWCAFINADGKMKYLGLFDDIKDAARAYNNAAREQFGEFAYLNAV